MGKTYDGDVFTDCVFKFGGKDYIFSPASLKELLEYESKIENLTDSAFPLQRDLIVSKVNGIEAVIDYLPLKVFIDLFIFVQTGELPKNDTKN